MSCAPNRRQTVGQNPAPSSPKTLTVDVPDVDLYMMWDRWSDECPFNADDVDHPSLIQLLLDDKTQTLNYAGCDMQY
jgi:hypothetical protein